MGLAEGFEGIWEWNRRELGWFGFGGIFEIDLFSRGIFVVFLLFLGIGNSFVLEW